MKKLIQKILSTSTVSLVTLSLASGIASASANHAKADSKIGIKQSVAKFTPQIYSSTQAPIRYPVTLKNGITISIENLGFSESMPVISKNHKVIWDSRKHLFPGGGMENFTLTRDGDTFFSFYSASGDGSVVKTDLLGIHANGKIFLNKLFSGDAGVRFITASTWEIAFLTSRGAQIEEYSLMANGTMKMIKTFSMSSDQFFKYLSTW